MINGNFLIEKKMWIVKNRKKNCYEKSSYRCMGWHYTINKWCTIKELMILV